MEPINKIEVRNLELIEVDINELKGLQNENFKDLSDTAYVKLRNSILQKKFSFPFFIWINPEGDKIVMDGHQRLRVIKRMRDEGVEVPLLKALSIQANSRVEAKELLLLQDSDYGKRTREGFDEFIDEVGFEIDESLEDLLVMPDMEYYGKSKDNKETQPNESKGVICPNCQTHFVPNKENYE